MRLAIISDVHGNWEAFQVVLEDIQNQHLEKIISLGDLIDYGPDSELIVQEYRRLNITSVIGNHEQALFDPMLAENLVPAAYDSFQITRRQLSAESIRWLQTLPPLLVIEQMRFVHGLPPDSTSDYIDYVPLHILRWVFQSYPEFICFVGHTHRVAMYEYTPQDYVKITQLSEIQKLKPTSRYIINAGSVGQPRDPDRRAKYVIYDTTQNSLELRRIEYDAQKTAAKIRQLGYPEIFARRLL